jgi:hypothetical protein
MDLEYLGLLDCQLFQVIDFGADGFVDFDVETVFIRGYDVQSFVF